MVFEGVQERLRSGIGAMTSSVENLSAAATWVAYDYALTFADEVEYVWKKPMRSGSVLFLWVRYYGLAIMAFKISITPSTAARMVALANDPPITLPVADLLGLFLIFSVQIILQTRIYALYMSRPLAFFNAVLFALAVILTLSLWGISHPFSCRHETFQQTAGCTGTYPLFWLPTLVFECWTGALAMYKLLVRMKGARPVADAPDVVSVFMRDSAIHYMSVILGIVIFTIVGSQNGAPGNSGFLQASVLIAGTRLVLHLRKAFYTQQTRVNEYPSVSTMAFSRHSSPSRIVDETFWGDDAARSRYKAGGASHLLPLRELSKDT